MKRLILLFIFIISATSVHAAISRDGSCAAAGTNCTVTTGASANGDLLVVFAYRNASLTAPALPAGYTNIFVSTGGATNSFRVYCHVSSGTGDATGTATNATGIVAVWYTGTSASTTAACATQAVALGVVGAANQHSGTAATTATYSGLTTSSGTTSSWIVGFMGDTVASDDCVPTGLTRIGSVTGNAQMADTNAAVTTWAQATCTITSATYRTYVLEILASDSGRGAGTPALIQVHDCSQAWGAFYIGNSPLIQGNTWECRLPQGAQAGNAIIVGMSNDPTTAPVPVVTDDKSDTYNLAINFNDSTNGENALLFYAPNVIAGAQHITITIGTGGNPFINPWIAEFTNVALSNALDVTTGHNASSTSVTAGSVTPSSSGDLVIQHYWNSYSVATTALTAGSQANITWALLAGDFDTGIGSQWGVYNSTAALNPTMTTAPVGFVSVAMFLKSSSAGSTPTGIRVLALKDIWENATATTGAGGPPWNANTRTVPFPCPASSNLMYAAWIGGSAATFNSVTDSHSQTWTATGAGVVNDSYTRAFYQDAATVSTNQTITLGSTLNSSDGTPKLYCVTGAASSSAFDKTATLTGDQTSNTGVGLATVSITPTAKGIIFASAGNAFTTLVGLGAGQFFHSGYSTAEATALNGVDQNNGWGIYQNPNTSSVLFTWTEIDNTTAAGNWAARADAFKAPAGAAAPRGKAVIF